MSETIITRTGDLGGTVAALMFSDGTYTVVEFDSAHVGPELRAILKLWARYRVQAGRRAAVAMVRELPDLID